MKKLIIYLILAGVLVFASVALAIPTSTIFSTVSVITQTVVSSTNASFTSATSTNFRFTNASGTNLTASGYLQSVLLNISGLSVLSSTTRSSADILVNTSSRGMVLTSPDGTCFRISVSNIGALSTDSLTCP